MNSTRNVMVHKGKQAKARYKTAGLEDERTSERESQQVGLLPLPQWAGVKMMSPSSGKLSNKVVQ